MSKKMPMTEKIAIVLTMIMFVGLYPIGAMWALNTLFGLKIAIGVKTWVACLVLWLVMYALPRGGTSNHD
jgi:hypothetical protein